MLERFGSLRFQIIFLIMMAMLPAVALTVYSDFEQRQIAISESKSDILATLRLMAAEERQMAEGTQQLLIALSHHLRLIGQDPSRCSETLRQLLLEYSNYRNFGVLDSEGRPVCSATSFDSSIDPLEAVSLQRALATHQFTIGDGEFDPATRQSSVRCYYPVLDEAEKYRGAIYAKLKLDWFYEMAASGRLYATSILTMIDAGGNIAARYPNPEGWIGKALPAGDISKAILSKREGMVEETRAEGGSRLHAIMPLGGDPARGILVLELPTDSIAAEANRRLARNMTILGLVTLVTLALGRLFGKVLIVNKMASLVSAAKRLATGDFSARSGLSGKGEFNHLGQIFDDMARSLELHDSERKQTEGALKTSEENFRNLVENSLTGIFIIQDGRMVFSNPEHSRRLLGGPVPRDISTWLDTVSPEDRVKAETVYSDLVSGRTQAAEVVIRVSRSLYENGQDSPRWVLCRASRIQYQGKPSILVNTMDITEMKKFELLAGMQDKMASLGRVAAGIVHELRNPLSAVNIQLANLERIHCREDAQPSGASAQKTKIIIDQLKAASMRIESIIRRVVDFSKPGRHDFHAADVNQIVESAADFYSTSFRKNGLTLEKSLAPELPECLGDPSALEQVIINLIGNSLDMMKDKDNAGQIGLSTHSTRESVVVQVFDSGPGVPLHLRERIFDPFFSTRKDSMGIGLSISQRIVLDHGGTIQVSESKWGGAQFTIEIPRADRNRV